MRYEDFCLEPLNQGKLLFTSLGLNITSESLKYLTSHTTDKIKEGEGMFRDSQANIVKWTKKLNFGEIETIQDKCRVAMELWGYKPLLTKEDLISDMKVRDVLDSYSFNMNEI